MLSMRAATSGLGAPPPGNPIATRRFRVAGKLNDLTERPVDWRPRRSARHSFDQPGNAVETANRNHGSGDEAATRDQRINELSPRHCYAAAGISSVMSKGMPCFSAEA